jgi:hypothetical protein
MLWLIASDGLMQTCTFIIIVVLSLHHCGGNSVKLAPNSGLGPGAVGQTAGIALSPSVLAGQHKENRA